MIDSKLQLSLRERFNPDGSPLRMQQLRLLDILIYIDDICRKNDITYWLSSGTALGAVRHGGFIPWDDDVDIEMTMRDYKKFESIMKNCTDYAFQTRFTDRFYSAPYGKVRDLHSQICEHPQDGNYKFRGLYVDVFSIEKNPSKIVSSLFSRLLWPFVRKGGLVKTDFGKQFFLLKRNFLYFLINIIRAILSIVPTKQYRHTLGSGYANNCRYLDEILPLREIEFEGHIFYIAGDYNAYLSRLYGDYMLLPNLDDLKFHVSDVKVY